jgi:hypothetical protein
MLSLGDSKLLETLLSKEFYIDTLGALECNHSKLILNLYIDDPEILQAAAFTKGDE